MLNSEEMKEACEKNFVQKLKKFLEHKKITYGRILTFPSVTGSMVGMIQFDEVESMWPHEKFLEKLNKEQCFNFPEKIETKEIFFPVETLIKILIHLYWKDFQKSETLE